MTQLVENNMLPVGTLVRYKGHDGFVNFVDVETGCMTICINTTSALASQSAITQVQKVNCCRPWLQRSIGRAVANETGGPRFESHHCQIEQQNESLALDR